MCPTVLIEMDNYYSSPSNKYSITHIPTGLDIVQRRTQLNNFHETLPANEIILGIINDNVSQTTINQYNHRKLLHV